jgi:hypothetical protein
MHVLTDLRINFKTQIYFPLITNPGCDFVKFVDPIEFYINEFHSIFI